MQSFDLISAIRSRTCSASWCDMGELLDGKPTNHLELRKSAGEVQSGRLPLLQGDGRLISPTGPGRRSHDRAGSSRDLDDAKALISLALIGSALRSNPAPSKSAWRPICPSAARKGSWRSTRAASSRSPSSTYPTDIDEDGILQKEGAATRGRKAAAERGARRAWFKLRAEAGVKAVGGRRSVGQCSRPRRRADLTVVFADYRRHDRMQPTCRGLPGRHRQKPRSITNRDHVESLEPGEALAFRGSGTIRAAVTVAWSDVSRARSARCQKACSAPPSPSCSSFKAGASVTAEVMVEDDSA